MKRLLPVLFGLFFGLSAQQSWAQNIIVSGKVNDANTGEPLIGASIQVKGTNRGAVTDLEGAYTLEVGLNAILVFSYTGYESIEVGVGGQKNINQRLSPSNLRLDEVVVVGYGVQKKSQITGAISSVKASEIKDQPVSNLAGSIQGRVSGLNVMSTSGTPGAGLLVSVRGNNAPLYVIDGIPQLSESNSSLSTSFNLQGESVGPGQNLSSIADINPNDIESIEILKDASAAAIYGARAANGVILITTKRGKKGSQEANLNYYTGLQRVARPIKFMDSEQFVALIEEARKNDLAIYQKDKTAFGPDFDPSVLTDPLDNFDLSSGLNTNWLDEVTQSAPISNYELSFRAGNDKTRYFTSFGYFDQTGVVINNFYKRLTYRLNLDQTINDRLTTGVTLNVAYSRNRRSFNDNTYTGTITNALGASPLMPVFEDDGSYSGFENYQASWLSDNPVKSATEIRAFTTGFRVLGSVYGEYKINPNLSFRTSFSTDGNFIYDDQFKSQLTADAEAVGGEAFEGNARTLTWLNENTLNYTKDFSGSSLTVLGGLTFQRTTLDRASALGQGFPPGGLQRVSSAANILRATSEGSSFAILSYLGRVNYDIGSRFLFTASARVDGSSRFAKDNRYGFFPSGAFAWRMSNEEFFKNFKGTFSDFKLRMSYGLTGDQEIGDFQNVTFYGPTRYDGRPGIGLRNLADPSLGWQQNRMLNLGIDFEIKGGRMFGSVEFFKANKDRLLSEDAIPGTTGFQTVTRNSGEVQNTGLEFNLTAAVTKNAPFRWNINLNGTFIRNKIISLSSDGILLNAYSDLEVTHVLQVGQSIGSFWGLKYLGVDPETGDVMHEDTNEDGVVDFDDAQIIGKAMPDFFGGFTNTFMYRNWDLSIFSRFSLGNQVYNLIRATTENLGWSNEGGLSSVYANNTLRVQDRWRKPGDQAAFGRASFVNPNLFINSSHMVEDASFFRIQNVNLGYTFGRVGKLKGLRVYAEAQNLLILTKYSGFDPEVSSNGGSIDRTAGIDYGAYPSARTFLLGANLKF
jgi:TonB-dependent starch-binding outer membrane protein SusC